MLVSMIANNELATASRIIVKSLFESSVNMQEGNTKQPQPQVAETGNNMSARKPEEVLARVVKLIET